MPEPTQLTAEQIAALQAENETLKRTNAELVAKHSRDKTRIEDFQSSATALQAKATEAETRVRQLTIDGPVNALCESISVAPESLRTALEADYRFELRDGTLTILNASDGQPVVVNGKPLPAQADAIKGFLLESKDEAKLKLYRAILVSNRASGAVSPNPIPHRVSAPAKHTQFGLR